MITGFGNNVVSALAADITANQTTIQVMPGTGVLFSGLLTYDYSNASNSLQTYAKITLTDAKETVFEICHLTAVSNDILTVIRAQEGTTAKGWSLNDVIGNFATRGSENQFVQIEQLQSGHYISGVAGGTANALTLELPATYFVNGSTDWTLRTPIVVYPTQNNTGAATLQLTMGGSVLGTFKLYKGNKAELVANDILKDVALVCLLDKTKSFFNVSNPGAIYAGLGTAAFCDVTTSNTDRTSGRVLRYGNFGVGEAMIVGATTDLNTITIPGQYKQIQTDINWSSLHYPITASGGLVVIEDAGYSDGCTQLYFPWRNDIIYYRNFSGTGSGYAWGEWAAFYSTLNKPTAVDVGALPITGGTVQGAMEIAGSLGVNGTIDSSSGTYDKGQRVYSPNNPQPIDLSGYATQNWVLQNFVQSIDLTAPAEVGFWDNNTYTRATDGAAMYNFRMVGGSSNVGNYIIRYTRRLVNNTWYVLN